jgi:hypothetical protein
MAAAKMETTADSFDLEYEVGRAVARFKSAILAVVFGLFGGVGVLAMTAILLIENGPNTGAHLQLLGHYFPGYTVTWPGAFVGLGWGFFAGALAGWLIGVIYNRIVSWRHTRVVP